tara:strand:+ start:1972 stop:3687 length:1716 start_codon:yes stop_codon:yes gene_type:complete
MYRNSNNKFHNTKLYFPDIRNNNDNKLINSQNVLCKLLHVFDFICKKNKIKYWMTAGTLIGAIRHKGIIPWDSDIDIAMITEDYNKLKKVIQKELPDDMFFQSPETDIFSDKNFNSTMKAKIRDRYSNYYEWLDKNKSYIGKHHNGLQLDIFVYSKKNNIIITGFKNKNGKYHKYDINDIFPLTNLYFNGRECYAPKNYDLYISQRFGDYMKLPPINKRIPHEGKSHAMIPCKHKESLLFIPKKKYNICICGGGNISHALSGTLAYKGHTVNILTRQPEKWQKKIKVNNPEIEYYGIISKISSIPKDVIPDCELIIISVPVFGIDDILNKIKPYLTKKMSIIGIPGRLYSQFNQDLEHINQIYLLRTPYISRINSYGSDVSITGYCYKELNYWSNNFEKGEKILNNLFSFKVNKIHNLDSINLVNSNTILHPSRLYSLFKDKKEYTYKPLFYGEWDLESSKVLVECDNELQKLIIAINNSKVENKVFVKTILEHYECKDYIELTHKIQNIASLSKITTTLIEKKGKYYCDYKSRYITEDIFIGMKYVIDLANKYNINIPKIKEIYKMFTVN